MQKVALALNSEINIHSLLRVTVAGIQVVDHGDGCQALTGEPPLPPEGGVASLKV
jgi:hypothetical protein